MIDSRPHCTKVCFHNFGEIQTKTISITCCRHMWTPMPSNTHFYSSIHDARRCMIYQYMSTHHQHCQILTPVFAISLVYTYIRLYITSSQNRHGKWGCTWLYTIILNSDWLTMRGMWKVLGDRHNMRIWCFEQPWYSNYIVRKLLSISTRTTYNPFSIHSFWRFLK